uniref:ribonucleoside-diphosphate reductase n=1 Tax=viral metagenome TaxID=1070528 RepID=A0A6M3KCA1_9ZZZZ
MYKRPDILQGDTVRFLTPYGKLYVTVNWDENNTIKEVFSTIGKSKETINAFTESISRLASMSLQNGVSPDAVANQLLGTAANMNCFHEGTGELMPSISHAIGEAILQIYNQLQERKHDVDQGTSIPRLKEHVC